MEYGSRTAAMPMYRSPTLADAFQLHPDARRRDEARAGDARGLLGDLLVVAFAHVEQAAGDIFVVRVGAFVHRMAGDRGDGAALVGMHRGDMHAAIDDFAQHGLLRTIGFGAERGAFQYLAEIVRQRLGMPLVHRCRREDRRIAAASADDHIGAAVEQRHERMHAGHRHDARGLVQFGLGQRRPSIQALDRIARTDLGAQIVLAHF